MPKDQTPEKVEEEPVESFIRQDEEEKETEATVQIIEGGIVEGAVEELDEEIIEEQADELTVLRQQLETAYDQAAEYLDDLRRERAAFLNYKKRQENERIELRRMAQADLLLKILPALADMDRALEAVPEDQANQPWIEGITLIQRKLQTALEGSGVVPVEAEPGQPFDPFMHEALSYEEHEDFQEGEIIAVVQKGHKLGERVLRPAMVRVAK